MRWAVIFECVCDLVDDNSLYCPATLYMNRMQMAMASSEVNMSVECNNEMQFGQGYLLLYTREKNSV